MKEIEIPGVELSGFIGSGANATVYAGFHAATNSDVAVKVMHVGVEGGARRFEREIEAMRRLTDVDGVVPVLDSGLLEKGRPFLVSPRYEMSLQEAVAETGVMSPKEATVLIAGIAKAIAEGHKRGVLHLDVKPSNILVDSDGRAHIADFGIAELTDASASLSGAMLTPQYAAPERLEDEAPTSAADVYALGATLFALLVGHPPFKTSETANPAAVMLRILNEDPPFEQLPESTPKAVVDAITVAMSREIEPRPTAGEFSRMLHAAVGSTGAQGPEAEAAYSDTRTVPVSSGVEGERNRRGAFILVAATALLLVIGFALSAMFSGDDEEPVGVEVAGASASVTDDEAEPSEVEQSGSQTTEAQTTTTTTRETPDDTELAEGTGLADDAELADDAASTTVAKSTTTSAAPVTTQAQETTTQPVQTTTTQAPVTTAAPVTTTTAAPATTRAPTTTTTAAPTTAAPLSVPTNLRLANQGHRNGRQFITIEWSAPAGVTGVDVQRDGSVVTSNDGNGVYSDEASFAQGQEVTYRVRSVAGGQTSEWSAPLTVVFTTPSPAPDVPADLLTDKQGHRNGRQFITIRWVAPAGAVVDVERDGAVVRVGDDNNVYSDEASFAQGQSVTYRVRSTADGQVSAWSSPITVVFNTPTE